MVWDAFVSLVGMVGNSLYGGENEASKLNWKDIVHGRQPGREEIAVGRSSADEDVGWMNVPLVFNSQPRGA